MCGISHSNHNRADGLRYRGGTITPASEGNWMCTGDTAVRKDRLVISRLSVQVNVGTLLLSRLKLWLSGGWAYGGSHLWRGDPASISCITPHPLALSPPRCLSFQMGAVITVLWVQRSVVIWGHSQATARPLSRPFPFCLSFFFSLQW